jgi:uncharacterized protein (TIGR00369 family)
MMYRGGLRAAAFFCSLDSIDMTPQDDNTGDMDMVPAGFERLKRGGPYMAGLGSLYCKRDGERITIAMRVIEQHTNMRGIVHGGALASLADSSLGLGLALSCDNRHSFVTVNLSTDFLDSARPGDWVEAHILIGRIGSRVAFAECALMVGERRILRASGVFAVMKPLTAAQLDAGY